MPITKNYRRKLTLHLSTINSSPEFMWPFLRNLKSIIFHYTRTIQTFFGSNSGYLRFIQILNKLQNFLKSIIAVTKCKTYIKVYYHCSCLISRGVHFYVVLNKRLISLILFPLIKVFHLLFLKTCIFIVIW